MTMKHSPAAMAEAPAQRMRAAGVIHALLVLIEVVPLAFIGISPCLNY
jgi:hypothetical protein